MTHFVRATRQSMVKGAARVNDLIGPFDTWFEAGKYAEAWRALWIEQRGKAFVEAPISPCAETLEWYRGKVERDDAAELARRAARDPFANTAQWEASLAPRRQDEHDGGADYDGVVRREARANARSGRDPTDVLNAIDSLKGW